MDLGYRNLEHKPWFLISKALKDTSNSWIGEFVVSLFWCHEQVIHDKKLWEKYSRAKSRPCDVRIDDDLQQFEGFLRGTNPEWCTWNQGMAALAASDLKGHIFWKGHKNWKKISHKQVQIKLRCF